NKITPDPTGFIQKHPSDNATYKQLGNLLSTEVVGFDESRIASDALYSLSDAYGDRGTDIVGEIKKAGRIVFPSIGDSGSTTQGKQYADELSVADQVTMDCNTTEVAN